MSQTSLISLSVVALLVAFGVASTTSAQTSQSSDAQIAQGAKEEKEGQEIWEKITKGELKCEGLGDEQYEALGEFFMGRMLGAQHAQMNQQMQWMMGKAGEEAMHAAMGKRMSGCDPNAIIPASASGGMMPMMMGMMGGGMMGGNVGWPAGGAAAPGAWNQRGWGMMSGPAFGWGWSSGWIMMLTWWLLLILIVLALVKYLKNH